MVRVREADGSVKPGVPAPGSRTQKHIGTRDAGESARDIRRLSPALRAPIVLCCVILGLYASARFAGCSSLPLLRGLLISTSASRAAHLYLCFAGCSSLPLLRGLSHLDPCFAGCSSLPLLRGLDSGFFRTTSLAWGIFPVP